MSEVRMHNQDGQGDSGSDAGQVQEKLRPYLKHLDYCDAAAWEQRRAAGQVPNYPRKPCNCGLDKVVNRAYCDEHGITYNTVGGHGCPFC